MSPGLISVSSATSEEFARRCRGSKEKYLLRSGSSSAICKPRGQKLHHPAFTNVHELAVFGREDQRWWMSKIDESKMAIRAYFTVKHGGNLLGALFLASAESITSGD